MKKILLLLCLLFTTVLITFCATFHIVMMTMDIQTNGDGDGALVNCLGQQYYREINQTK